MRFGFDAKWFFDGPPSGKRVVQNFVRELTQSQSAHEAVIFLDRRFRNQPLPFQARNIEVAYVWGGNNLLANVFLLPFYARRYRLDAMVYQNFATPFGRCAKISCIYDVIFLVHPEYYTLMERMYFFPMRVLTKFATRVITISHSEKRRISQNLVAKDERIDVIPLGVESHFRPLELQPADLVEAVKRKYGLPDSYLLYVGRLNVRKNVPNLLRAFAMLENNDIQMVLVGKRDWKFDDIGPLLSQLAIKERVSFIYGASNVELAPIYSLAKVFCYPSSEEGFGLPPLEAMASGIPVVVSHTSSLPEVCGEAGNYVDVGDPSTIAAMIDKLLEDDSLYKRQREKGLRQAQQFRWDQSLRLLLQYVEAATIQYCKG